jgi:hypothetical protein
VPLAPQTGWAQEGQATQPPAQVRQRGQGGPGGRANLPPIGRGMNAQQLQDHLDAYAITQAQRELKLGEDQYPGFVARMTRLHNLRRRLMQERRRLLGELRQLLEAASPRDDVIGEKVGALEVLNRRSSEALTKAYQDIDAVLTPWQRGRFRLLEEQLERQKIELLARITG